MMMRAMAWLRLNLVEGTHPEPTLFQAAGVRLSVSRCQGVGLYEVQVTCFTRA